jgi:hypothetical protein
MLVRPVAILQSYPMTGRNISNCLHPEGRKMV